MAKLNYNEDGKLRSVVLNPEEYQEYLSLKSKASESDKGSSETEIKDIKIYRGRRYAKGYYKGYNLFCVLKGSKASGSTTSSFDRSFNSVNLRETLIKDGVLARKTVLEDYEFTTDYVFKSPSAAANIIDGNPRSGTSTWGFPPKT